MKITTGIDIIEVERIKESIEKYGSNFLNKIYSGNEIEYCNKSNIGKYERFAVRFAAKEAVYKALNIEEAIDMEWNEIEVCKNTNGRPYIKLNNAFDKYNNMIENMDISLSHIKETATASVVVCWK